jgi:hypothetical protein
MSWYRLVAGLFVVTTVPGIAVTADPPTPTDRAAFDKLVIDTLRDVHNTGADLFNTAKDFNGTYRMYQGALLTVRPLLAHHAAAQKLIDDGLAAAEGEPNPARKAFKLHETIEAVRGHLKTAGSAPATTNPKSSRPRETAPPPREVKPGMKKDREKETKEAAKHETKQEAMEPASEAGSE